MKKYLAGFGDSTPDRTRRGSFTAKKLLGGEVPAGVGTRAPKKRRPKRKVASTAVIPPDFTCDVRDRRISDFCDELKTINVEKCPNAASLMFRTFLELSMQYYLRQTGHVEQVVKEEKARRQGHPVPSDWHPSLSVMLKYITRDSVGIISDRLLLRAVRQFRSKQKYLSLDSLNSFVHNPYVPPDPTAVRAFWTQLQGLFELLLATSGEQQG